MRMGSGTRLKVLEGLAMSKAIVSTSLGCEGLAVRDGEHLLVADDPCTFARAVLRVLDDTALAMELGRCGRALVERAYGWASAVHRLEAFYAEILGGGQTRPGSHDDLGSSGRREAEQAANR
jgi:glycosyltransferase involved in cell wall biosynthesis